ncbi:AlpA family phage regulatory protein [Escherichia coli]|uniref:helix-turn-helix transcriptional regulator n=1 Tax=Escherichia coli TaxID=562 RepID=UPI0001F926E8|nr:AlpA family phage regulatory protein [Escherichia coli]EFA8282745.1 AlpA family phage regulatory protein [Escherichia coli O157]EEW4293823.1 AlpA family phage regulatory protein [Escherichia coli]EEZ5826707.1 AlpA family phage regulatory protein [Escherichia coli]EFG4662334.1 AlpA family phage regulatory protein [Escherichia coli]EFH7026431.1 AlpA family phage regulatory protein [Escherichia coli]
MYMLNIAEVERRTSYSRKTIYRKIARGEFPAQVRMGARHVAWLESDVNAWIASQVAGSQTPRGLCDAEAVPC